MNALRLLLYMFLLVAAVLEAAADDTPPPRTVTGKRGIATKSATVNFFELADREKLYPVQFERSQVQPAPRPAPAEPLPVKGTEIPAAARFIPASSSGPSPAPASSFLATDCNSSFIADTMGAVGPNHLMVALNGQIRIQDRIGRTLSVLGEQSFWSGASSFLPPIFDPTVLYDPFAGRWILCESGYRYIMIGVSETSDPTGNWFLHEVEADPSGQNWADFPRLGFNREWIVVTADMASLSDGSRQGVNLFVFHKANLYAGLGADPTLLHDSANPTMVPCISYDNSLSTMYLLQTWNNQLGALRLSTINGPHGSEVLTVGTEYPIGSPWGLNPVTDRTFAPQLGTTNKINVLDPRLQNLVYRNGRLWTAHTVFLPAGSPTRSSVQWWEFRPSGVVYQFGRIDDPRGDKFYGFPSIAVNARNDVLIGFSSFSITTYASAAYAYRSASDPPNSMRADFLLKAGEGPVVFNRWGDYSATVVDPVNDVDMWTIQEYAEVASPFLAGSDWLAIKWGTWWGRITSGPVFQSAGQTIASENCISTNNAIDPGETVTVALALRNLGIGNATNVIATLRATDGIVPLSGPQNYGAMTANGPVESRLFSFRASGVCGGSVKATLDLQDGGMSVGSAAFTFRLGQPSASPVTIENANPISIPGRGRATPYPSVINVPTNVGRIAAVRVRLNNLTHPDATDVAVQLVGPNGNGVVLMSEAGWGALTNGTLTFDDDASELLPLFTPFASGSYKPTNYRKYTTLGDAPEVSYATNLSIFDGTSAAGAWSLYVLDSASANGEPGILGGGWSLIINESICCSSSAYADLAVSTTAAPDQVVVQSTLAYRMAISNAGPAMATQVSLTNILPAGVALVSSTPSQGTCSNVNGAVTCDLGSLSPGSNATVVLTVVSPVSVGLLTNAVVVWASEVDPILADNVSSTTSRVILCPLFTNTFTGAITAGDVTQRGRITQALNCAIPCECRKVCSHYFDDLNFAYDGYTVINSAPVPMEFTVNLTACTDSNALGAVAYLGDSSRLCDNHLADIGTGANAIRSFSFTVPANTNAVLVIYEMNSSAGCSNYTVEIIGQRCSDSTGCADMTLRPSSPYVYWGGWATLSLFVENQGSVTATNVTVHNTLPASFRFISATMSVPDGVCANEGGTITCWLGSVEPQTGASVMIQAQAMELGSFAYAATVAHNGCDSVSANDTATGTITVQRPTANVSILSTNASENGTGQTSFLIWRSYFSNVVASNGVLGVNYALSGTASNGVDYEPLSGSVTIPDGATNVIVSVIPIDDGWLEGDETMILTLLPGSNYVTYSSSRSATNNILDNDVLGLLVSTNFVRVPEGGSASFTVQLNGPPTNAPGAGLPVTFTRTAGDPDLRTSGSTQVRFKNDEWSIPRTFSISADADVDWTNGTATFMISGDGLSDVVVTAVEIDDDPPPPGVFVPVLHGATSVTGVVGAAFFYEAAASSYGMTAGRMNWSNAESAAVTLGGHLTAINSREEQEALERVFMTGAGEQTPYWIGLNDAAVPNTFVWSSGEPVAYTKWKTGEPNVTAQVDLAA